MRYSKMFTRTQKSSKTYDSVNATYLIRGAFIDQTMAGVYTFLPLGLRVLNKIENIVREEMDKIAVECLMPALSPKSLWETTGRLNTIDILMKTSGANQISQYKNTSEYILNCTQEEVITPIALKFNRSYKQLPAAMYQIQSKFRNEARAKSGIMRGREFRMKDLYSFHESEESLLEYYHHVAKPAYREVFKRLGIGQDTVIALASGGDFTKEYSHEFQTKCASGEDQIYYVPSKDLYYNGEVAPSKASDYDWGSEPKELEDVYGENITGMKALVKFLNLPLEQCVKTLIYQTDKKEIVAVAVRGDYDVNQHKLMNILGCKSVTLAPESVVRDYTGAELGYAGIIGLPDNVEVYVDDSLESAVNFECGANKTNYHYINVNWDRDLPKPDTFYDLKSVKSGDRYPETDEVYEVSSAAEVGNIFPLNTKFSKAFNYTFNDKSGKEQLVYMGSYGIGTSRLMGVIVEKFHDEKGIIWPESVAPFKVHLISLKGVEERGQQVYQALQDRGVEVLWDDRDESPGTKFSEADIIGCPIRLVVSQKTADMVEWKLRNDAKVELLTLEETMARLSSKEI